MTSVAASRRIGRRLAAARLQRGLSQGTVARLARLHPSYLSRVENGRIHPSFQMVQRIAGVLRVALDDLAGSRKGAAAAAAGCPISRSGMCMLDLIRSEAEVSRAASGEIYSPREIRILQRLSEWMQGATSERLRAMEVLVGDLLRASRADAAPGGAAPGDQDGRNKEPLRPGPRDAHVKT